MMSYGQSVALVTPRYAPSRGGVERHVEVLARGLVNRGIGVEVLAADPTHRLPAREERDGVLVRRFPTVGLDHTYFLVPSLGYWLARNAERFALVHAHSYHATPSLHAAVASWWTRTPLVFTPHYHGTGHSPARSALHAPYRFFGARMVRHARQVICVSRTEQEVLGRHFGPHVLSRVIPNGVSVDEIVTARPHTRAPGRVLVLAVGRLESYKQIDRLVAALEHLPTHYEALIVGDGPERQRLEGLAARLGLRQRSHFVDHLARPELVSWYRAADVFVSLSRHEAFGLTLLEAAVAGSPLVISDIPAHREVAGYMADAPISFVGTDCSPAELARTIQTVHESTLQQAGRRTSLDVPTWDDMVDATLACYRALAGLDEYVRSPMKSAVCD
jgi:glycosyltransferase involved in cell wall biosynthesis